MASLSEKTGWQFHWLLLFSLTEIIHQVMINSSKSRREEVLIRRKHFSQLLPALETEIDSKPSGSLQEIHGIDKEG